MNESRYDYWFPAKRAGWGWGAPATWQGWFVLIAYLALVIGGITYFKARRDVVGLSIYLAVITSLLFAVMFMKGEQPGGK